MIPSKREFEFAEKYFNEVHHTTIDPEGPGVVRIHLIPPKYDSKDIGASVAIINGQDIVPVNLAWSILLTTYIEEVNQYSGRQITDEEAQLILDNTASKVSKVYPLIRKKTFKKDIIKIMQSFKQIAYGEEVDEAIGYMTIGDYAEKMTAPHRMDLMVSAMTKNVHRAAVSTTTAVTKEARSLMATKTNKALVAGQDASLTTMNPATTRVVANAVTTANATTMNKTMLHAVVAKATNARKTHSTTVPRPQARYALTNTLPTREYAHAARPMN